MENGGIVARIRGKEGKNAFLLRADMDALPLLEQSGESFASTNGRMHACGHDIHTAMLLGAARLLKEREESLPGTVLLVFQSNEEGIAGMQVLLDHGLLDKDHVGAALALHVLPGHGMDAGTYSCLPGPANASVDEYRIEIRGKGTHGAMPYKGVDPINVGIHICNALAAMMTKEVDGRQVTVLSNGYFNSGSPLAYNIIPNTALVGGGLRTTRRPASTTGRWPPWWTAARRSWAWSTRKIRPSWPPTTSPTCPSGSPAAIFGWGPEVRRRSTTAGSSTTPGSASTRTRCPSAWP